MNMILYRLTKLESQIASLYAEGKYTEAIEIAHELLNNAKKAEDQKAIMNAYLNLGSCYYYLGQIESAFEFVLEYKLLCDEYGDDRDKFYLYNLSALIYEFEENYDDAKKAMKECINLALELEMFHFAAISYNTYSTYLLAEDFYQEAKEYANLAMSIATSHFPSDILLHCQIMINIAAAHIGLGNYDEAKEILEPIKYNPYLNNNLYEKGRYQLVLATLYRKIANYKCALDLLKQAKELFIDYNNGIMLKLILKEKTRIYELLGDYQTAFLKQKQYIQYCEKLFKIRLSSKVRELDIKHSLAAIEKRANIDSLTGVYNRYYLETTCNKWLKEVKNTGSYLCCIVFDVDHFKTINDTYGHLVGDDVIKAVGKTCAAIQEENTLVARYGGDEFVAILKGYTKEQMMKKSQQLFTSLTKMKIPYLNNIIQISVSMGLVCTESLPSIKKFSQLFKLADQALYIAKKQGRNQIIFLSRDNCFSS